MTKYEVLCILDTQLADDAKEAIIKKLEELVTANGGVVEKTDRWGVKKLQYPINFKSEGYYFLSEIEIAPSFVAEFRRVSSLTDGIIRCLITKR